MKSNLKGDETRNAFLAEMIDVYNVGFNMAPPKAPLRITNKRMEMLKTRSVYRSVYKNV